MFRRFFLAIACSLAAVGAWGCASRINKVMESWVGHHVSDVVARWVAPDRTVDFGGCGKMYVWSEFQFSTRPPGYSMRSGGSREVLDHKGDVIGDRGPGYGSKGTRTPNLGKPPLWLYTRSFWVGHDGKVYKWPWQGRRDPHGPKPPAANPP